MKLPSTSEYLFFFFTIVQIRDAGGGYVVVHWDDDMHNVCNNNLSQVCSKQVESENEHSMPRQLPPSLFNCCQVLEKLNVNLTGSVKLRFKLTSTLGSCYPLLKQLLLVKCKGLSGVIPQSIGDCTSITGLDLCGCTSLSDLFPESLGGMEHL